MNNVTGAISVAKNSSSLLPVGSKFPQLWMTAFYPGRVGTSDPGSPAFRLPFQGLTTRNHIGQWTEKVVVVQ